MGTVLAWVIVTALVGLMLLCLIVAFALIAALGLRVLTRIRHAAIPARKEPAKTPEAAK